MVVIFTVYYKKIQPFFVLLDEDGFKLFDSN